MNTIGKNFTSRAIENAVVAFPGIKLHNQIQDIPRQVRGFHYCRSNPRVRKNPHLCAISTNLLEELGYAEKDVLEDEDTPLYLSGSKLMQGSVPVAHNYCGFQFGVWAGQLGDGRAHTLGTIKNNGKIIQLQLKGSGLSPFSRHADGNSVLSSAVRQFLASELMAGLKVPTTRALSLVIAEEDVIRDPLYNGITRVQKAAIVLRTCSSFLRFGSFQAVPEQTNPNGNTYEKMIEKRKYLAAMADYLIQNFYSDIDEQETDIYEQLFRRIVISSAEMVAAWQSIGFVHGVLNTDNMSMMGVTIDYGPFGFIDYFSKDYTSNATDQHERYSYRQQPFTIKWNLERLAQAMDNLVPQSILKEHIKELFDKTFEKSYNQRMSLKLGLPDNQATSEIVSELLEVMHICGSNFTETFRKIAQYPAEKLSQVLLNESLPNQYYLKSLRVMNETKFSEERIASICAHDTGFNPHFLREQGKRKNLLDLLIHEQCEDRTTREKQLWDKWLAKYQAANPNPQIRKNNTIQYVLLNQVAKNITDELKELPPAEQRQLMSKVLQVFSNPYKKCVWFEQKYWSRRPIPIRLTCSS